MQQGDGLGGYLGLLASQGYNHYWELQSGISATATEEDLIGLGASDHTRITAASTTTTGPSAVLPNAITNGTGSYRGGISYDINNSFTMTMWARSTGLSGNPVLYRFLNITSHQYCFLIHRDDRSGLCLQISTAGGAAVFVDTSTRIDDGDWHHIAVSHQYSVGESTDNFLIYIDGSLVVTAGRTTIGWAINHNPDEHAIGAQSDASALPWPHQIAAVGYKEGTTSSGAEILAQYELGSGV